MFFEVGETFQFEGHQYTVPPAFAGADYPIEEIGGRATVIRVQRVSDRSLWAVKAFKPRYRTSRQLEIVERLNRVRHLPGLEVAQQSVIRPEEPIAQAKGLEWGVLMPWAVGDTWGRILGGVEQQKLVYTRPEAEALAREILTVLEYLERMRLVHCDLSPGNMLVQSGVGMAYSVQLVDLEGMLIEGLEPASVTPGSDGYALPGVRSTACPEGDRYAGAILTAEALALGLPHDSRLVRTEGVFRGNRDNSDAQARFNYVHSELTKWHPRFADLLLRAWDAGSLAECSELKDLLGSLSAGAVPVSISTPSGGRKRRPWETVDSTTQPPTSPGGPAVVGQAASQPSLPEAAPPVFAPRTQTPITQAVNLPPVRTGRFDPPQPAKTQPGATQASTGPSVLFDHLTVAYATFLGSPAAGGLVMAYNYHRVGSKQSAIQAVVFGILATVAVIGVAAMAPAIGVGLWAGAAVVAGRLAQNEQGAILDNHLKAGGRPGSRWMSIAWACAGLVTLLVLLLAATAAHG